MTRQISAGRDYKAVKGRDGRIRVVLDMKSSEARLDVSTRLKRRRSRKQRWKAVARAAA